MDQRVRLADLTLDKSTASYTIVYGFLALYAAYQLLVYFDVPILSPAEIFWNALVCVIPTRLLLDAAKRQELQANNMLSQSHAAKGEALRKMLGLGTGAFTHKLSGGEGIMRKMSMLSTEAPTTDAPPGLGNWDNSCYQNSVLQGLASVGTLRTYLEQPHMISSDQGMSTSSTLHETIAKLNDRGNNGKQLWTPAKLKSMSSWQQQDAQEYFSKIMDELDKDAAKAAPPHGAKSGLEGAAQGQDVINERRASSDKLVKEIINPKRNPMEGSLAQRVACTRCGFSEGLSMIPFNCLTVPLGAKLAYELADCLDEYTKLEEIDDVDCARCTLQRAELQLQQLLPVDEVSEAQCGEDRQAAKVLSLPPDLRSQVVKRLQAIQRALEDDDMSDKTLTETCQIPKKAHVSSTKTRQAVIGRAPQSLVVHVNRSVFDEMTGAQRKNYANVRYPMVLDLQAWMLGPGSGGSATQSMVSGASGDDHCRYRLRAVVTHYGRHENGHYICYRRHPTGGVHQNDDEIDEQEPMREKWWRLSDEDVSAVSEEDVLAQGGVFMLFYEREDGSREQQKPEQPVDAAEASICTAAEVDTNSGLDDKTLVGTEHPTQSPSEVDLERNELDDDRPEHLGSMASEEFCSTGTTTEDESEATDVEEPSPVKPVPRLPSPSLLRTSRAQQASGSDNGFGKTLRAVAAT